MRLSSLVLVMVFWVSVLYATGCHKDEPDECEEYCATEEECAHTLDTLLSVSACERECHDDLEAYDNIACGDEFLDLTECRAELPCTSSSDLGRKCASEMERLHNCLE